MTAVDTSAEAIESAWEEFEVSSKPTGESDGYEMFNVEGMGDDAWNIIVITRALAAERDALRLSLAEARNAALRFVHVNDEYDEGKPTIMREYAASRAAILSLKTPTGEDE